ncbi:MAG: hypothetical protein JO096_01655, partial [Alphaproteobacteria bacterium]|nr:hypothetical protein [Alphaproteobacteria bacterium]
MTEPKIVPLRTPRFILVIAAALLATGLSAPPASAARGHPKAKTPTAAAQNQAKPDSGMETQAKHAFIIEVETGTVLLDKSADERM